MPMGIFLKDYGIRVNTNWVYKTKVEPLYGQLQEHVYMYTVIHMIQHHVVNCLVTYKYQEWRC